MNKTLIIGLDLSFSCTGITISYLEDNVGKSIQFHRVIFDDNSNKTNKKYTPTPIKNVNTVTYRLPTNILISDMVFDKKDINNFEQCESTLKGLISSKKIGIIIAKALDDYKPDEAIFCIENYIMPSFEGQNQLKVVAGLIQLQGYVRELIIRFCLDLKIPFKLFTPTPKSNKLFFTKNGNADKSEMLKIFLTEYQGNKLLPTITMESVHQINDVIDAFSLCMYAYGKIISNNIK